MIWELLLTALLTILANSGEVPVSSIAHFGEVKKVRDLLGSHCQWLHMVMYVVSVTHYVKYTLCQIELRIQSKCMYKYIYKCTQRECTYICTLWCRLSYHLRRTHLFRSLHQRERNVGVSQAPWLSSDCLSSQSWISHLYKRMRKILRYQYMYVYVHYCFLKIELDGARITSACLLVAVTSTEKDFEWDDFAGGLSGNQQTRTIQHCTYLWSCCFCGPAYC